MRFERLDEGFISRRPATGMTAVAAGSRCAITDNGEMVCTYMVQEALGKNNFKPMISRSRDEGRTWIEEGMIWPHLQHVYSIFGSVSRTPQGELLFFGGQTPIEVAGESFWSEETQGIKQNELVWSSSTDGGRTWSRLHPVPMPIPGSAEVPAPICATRAGAWICCYSPYNTFDPGIRVDRSQVVFLRSQDQGQSWSGGTLLRFAESESTAAEAWVIELADGLLLGTCWNIAPPQRPDLPNAYALSRDNGKTWTPTRSTGTLGQSTGLGALADGRALFAYNQRKHGDPGIHLAVCRPAESGFGIEMDELVWQAARRTQSGTSGEHDEWQDFSFGEPAVVMAPDGALLLTFWCVQPAGQGIGYVRLALRE